MIARLKLRIRARRFGRMRELALIDWWLAEIRESR
jgi:hypothetical protein